MRAKLLIVLLAWCACSQAADFNYASYRSAWLADAASTFQLDPRADVLIDASMKKFHTVAIWTGAHREITPRRKQFIELWAKALQLAPGTADLFGHEVEMRQGETSYWMPIQSRLLEPLGREVAPETQTHLYLLLAGASDQAPVFLVNEFDALQPEDNVGE